ncbi:hypothetical protein MKQ68_09165 [Chitinophaga horti]|uniref:Secreted protein n=1 Tax=Chitinophaga horti TaxID=2920382 RepID=A0ABY6J6H9_9BACT|nr:hypothetical protein [Chitinophaga horti]UYQ95265.1 hypothetical protein MKQ68_09165 [Chitinophaga horti]
MKRSLLVRMLAFAFLAITSFSSFVVEGESWDDPAPPVVDVLTCPGRGGTEMPGKILLMKNCWKEVSAGIEGIKVVRGKRCVCGSAPTGYQGVVGCDLTWQTSCVG